MVDGEAKEPPILCAIVMDDALCPYSLCDIKCQQTDSIPKKSAYLLQNVAGKKNVK